ESVVVGTHRTRYSGTLTLNRDLGPGNNGSLFIANGAADCSYRGGLRIGSKKQSTDTDDRHLQAKFLKHTNLLSFGTRRIIVRDDHARATFRKVKKLNSAGSSRSPSSLLCYCVEVSTRLRTVTQVCLFGLCCTTGQKYLLSA